MKQETSLPLTSSAFCATCSAKTQDVQSDYFACISVGVKRNVGFLLSEEHVLHFYKVDFLFFVAFLSYDILFLHVYR